MDYKLKSGESFNIKNGSGTTILKIDSTGDGGVYIKGVGGYDGGSSVVSASTIQVLSQKNYFYIEAIENTTISFYNLSPGPLVFRVSKNLESWDLVVCKQQTTEVTQLIAGERLFILGDVNNKSGLRIKSTGRTNVGGELMSLYGFKTTLENSQFEGLFTRETTSYNPMIVSAENLIFPSLNSHACYKVMFSGCYTLITPPKILPASKAYNNCYENMFFLCSAMTTAPEIGLTNASNYCCRGMFTSCSSLVESPILWANLDTSTYGCYDSMFEYCSSLNKITMLADTIGPIGGCGCCVSLNQFNNWVHGVSSNGVFIKSSAINVPNDFPYGISGVPSGWTVQNYGS